MGKKILGFLVALLFSTVIFAATDAAAPAPTTYGPTTVTDNLYRVALKLRPNEQVSVQQVMLALLHANPEAFTSDNVNALNPGYVLELPALDEITSVSSEKAFAIIKKQNRLWKENAGKLPPMSKQEESADQGVNTQPTAAPIITAPAPTTAPDNTNQETTAMAPLNAFAAVAIANNIAPVPAATDNSAQTDTPTQSTNASVDTTSNAAAVKNVTVLKQQLSKLKQQQALNSVKGYPKHDLFVVLLFGLALVILLLVRVFMRDKKVVAATPYPPTAVQKPEDNSKDDFDFMQSKEGISAKLNLARAYLDMGKVAEAETLLKDVAVHGALADIAEAKKLLEKVKKAQD